MGKQSRAQRLKAAQPAAQDKGWCDHCLDVLHDTGGGRIADQLIETYVDMREGGCSHAAAMAGIEAETTAIVGALRSSGEQYRRDGEIEYGDGASSEEEFNAWDARRKAREARRMAEASA